MLKTDSLPKEQIDVAEPPARVCFVIENLLPAGTELWIVRLIQNLDRTRVKPYLCLLDGNSPASRGLEPDCPVLRLGVQKLLSPRGTRAAFQFRKFLVEHKIDIGQVHHADPTYFATPIAKLAGVGRIVQTKFDTGYWLSGIHLWLHRAVRPLIHRTIANSQACVAAAQTQEWACRDSVTILENGIPMDRLLALEELRLPRNSEDITHVGMVCNLRPIKDPSCFLMAARDICADRPNVLFHIAGDGELLDSLMNSCCELQLEERIKFHGAVSDIPAFLSRIHIAVLCSRSEGLSHAIMEYMAAGRVIVATDVGGNGELIEDAVHGLLVPLGEPSILAETILAAMDFPEEAEQMARTARNAVKDRFGLPMMTRRFENFYQELRRESSKRKD